MAEQVVDVSQSASATTQPASKQVPPSERLVAAWQFMRNKGPVKIGHVRQKFDLTVSAAAFVMKTLREQGCVTPHRTSGWYVANAKEPVPLKRPEGNPAPWCTTCRRNLPRSAFDPRDGGGRGVRSSCRECYANWRRTRKNTGMWTAVREHSPPPGNDAGLLLDGLTRCWGVPRHELEAA
jgi:hypothetical protein